MINCNENNLEALVKVLARTLSPKLQCRRNDIARQWIFEKSNWVADEVYDKDSKALLGVKLVSSEFNRVETAHIEVVLAMLMGEAAPLMTVPKWTNNVGEKNIQLIAMIVGIKLNTELRMIR